MHDDLLERRLRVALHAEGDSLPFTITPDELRRRLGARRRERTGRTGMVLIAAALAIGLLGAGVVAGGWLSEQRPNTSPIPSAPIAEASTPGVTPEPSILALPLALPTIDDLIAGDGGEDHLVLAQSNGPADGPAVDPNGPELEPPDLTFGPALPPGAYRLTFACLGPAKAGVELRSVSSLGGILVPTVACSGAASTVETSLGDAGVVRLVLDHRASWRLAVHRIGEPVAMATGAHDTPEPVPTEREALARFDLSPQGSATDEPTELQGIPTRESYTVDVACSDAPTVRYGFGADTGTTRTIATTTVVPCDGKVHTARIAIGELLGPQLFAQVGEATATVAISSDMLPIEAAGPRPGWQVSSGFGPSYTAVSQLDGVSLVANQNQASGPILVVFSCAGTGPLSGYVDAGKREGEKKIPFAMTCSADGTTISKTYQISTPNVTLYFTAPARSYIAITALEPTR